MSRPKMAASLLASTVAMLSPRDPRGKCTTVVPGRTTEAVPSIRPTRLPCAGAGATLGDSSHPRPAPEAPPMPAAPDPIVILGGGFAGVNAARHLERHLPRGHEIVLFSQENHLVFTPLLGNVVGSSINPMHVVWPVRQMLRRAVCRTAAVTDIDL